MKKKQNEYGLTGFFIGLIIGALAGLFFLNQIKKSQRGKMLPITISVGGILCAIGGYNIGSRLGKEFYVEERIGLKNMSEGYNKNGRYWYGITKWTDNRNNEEYTLITGRSTTGELASALNNVAIFNHQIRNANQQTVPKYHTQARIFVFKKLKENFTEEAVKNLKELFSPLQ